MSAEIDLVSYGYARVERYCDMAAMVFLGYEHFLQFSAEVELFWRRRWSFGKCLFLWSRYYSIAFNIVNTWAFVTEHPSEEGARFFHWQNTGASLQVVTTHLILVLRIYAMYGSTRIMLGVCSCLVICEALAVGIIFGLPRPGLIAGNNPAPGVYICADGDPPHSHWISFYWTTVLITESTLLCLSLYKGWQNRRSGYGSSVLRILTRDSVLYFIAIFWIYLLNQILWLINIVALDELGTGLATCISTVLANRLMIAVRRHYYGHEHDQDDPTTMNTMQFRSKRTDTSKVVLSTITDTPTMTTFADPELADTAVPDEDDEYEMQDFSERRGF